MKKQLFLILVTALLAVTSAFAQTRELQIFKDGSLLQSYPVSSIDSVKVGYAFSAPASVSAQVSGKNIVVSWSSVTGAKSYQLFRSSDNKNYVLLAGNLTSTGYTDSSPLKGTNYYKVRSVGENTESALSTSMGTATLPGSGLESGLYLSIMGFNQNVSSQPISILKTETKSSFDSFIDAMTMKNGTVLCFSMDQAINALQAATMPDDIFNVAIVTFTDGLDQGSLMLDDRFDNDDAYLEAIHQRITKETVAGLPISAYSIGLRGSDVTSASDIAKFNSTLKQLASNEANATEVTSMSEVNAKFQEIAGQLSSASYLQTISLTIPGLSNGTRIRFTFDNVSTAANSEVYVEGTFNLRSYSLTDVKYQGMTSTSGTTITGTKDGIFITFKFDGIQTSNGKLLSSGYIDEWYLTSSDFWQINSEFNKDENSDVVYEKKSAVIMLVLDCSSSLGSQFSTMKTNAKSFVNKLSQPSEGGDTPQDDESPQAIDLGLSVKWASMNVGAKKPEEPGDYFAWGETTPKTKYGWGTYKWCNNGSSTKITKYCNNSSYGTVDNKTSLELSDDAARANWGDSWRMPTLSEMNELRRKCTWMPTKINGVNVYKVTGPSGNYIYLPLTGSYYEAGLKDADTNGSYWTSSLYTSEANYACNLYFSYAELCYYAGSRSIGMCIRPVTE